MRKEIFLFRHGQTNLNLKGVWQGSGCDAPLNKTGKEQAKKLGKKLRSVRLDVIYCSSLKRAIETGKIVARNHIPRVLVIPFLDLQEGYFGDAEGLTFDEVKQKYGFLVDTYMSPTKETWNCKFSFGESKHEIFDRVIAAIKELCQFDETNIGIVTHAGVLSALACGLELSDVSFDNCSVLHLQYDTDTEEFTQIKD